MRPFPRRPLIAATALLLPGIARAQGTAPAADAPAAAPATEAPATPPAATPAPPAATPEPQAAAPAAPPADIRFAERGVGSPDAPVVVQEFFSLTCGHCAAFHKDVYPRVKRELIDAGVVRLVWRDFPLDRLALAAAAVARNLPVARYEGFIATLLGNQDRWAFVRGNPVDALAGMAALAGMPRPTFDQVLADEAFQRAILEQRAIAEREFNVEATPSFSFKGRGAPIAHKGGLPFDDFRRKVEEARRT